MVVNVTQTHIRRLCDVVNALRVANEVKHAAHGESRVKLGAERQKHVCLGHPARLVADDERPQQPVEFHDFVFLFRFHLREGKGK